MVQFVKIQISSLFDYEPCVRTEIRRVKEDLLLALVIIFQSGFGPITNKQLGHQNQFLGRFNIFIPESTIWSKNEET